MKTGRSFLLLFLLLLFILAVFIQVLKFQDMNRKMTRIGNELSRLDGMILEEEKALQILRENDSRLVRLAGNSEIYYLPVSIEGKELHVPLKQTEMDHLSSSLALKDLLLKYHAGKGAFQSGDPREWKKVLVRSGIKAKSHLRDVEIPAVRKRIAEVEKEAVMLQAERSKLFAEYQALQQRLGDASK